jgi:hypothetical protein
MNRRYIAIFLIGCVIFASQRAGQAEPAIGATDRIEIRRQTLIAGLTGLAIYLRNEAGLYTQLEGEVERLSNTDNTRIFTEGLESLDSRSVIVSQVRKDFVIANDNANQYSNFIPRVIGDLSAKTHLYDNYSNYLDSLVEVIKSDRSALADGVVLNSYVPHDIVSILRANMQSSDVLAGAGATNAEVFLSFIGQNVDVRVVGPGSGFSVGFPAVGAVLQDYDDRRFETKCTGTLIHPQAVLSAAHCFCRNRGSALKNGSDCRRGKFPRENAQETLVPALDTAYRRIYFQHSGVHEIERIEIPDSYSDERTTTKNDIAIVFLKEPVAFVLPAGLNFDNEMKPGDTGVLVGFGQHSSHSPHGTILGASGISGSEGLKVFGKIRLGTCNQQHNQTSLLCWDYRDRISPRVASASVLISLTDSGLSNTCAGDSGGPLFKEGTSLVSAVTSGGSKDDCDLGDHSFSTSVFSQKQWIQDTLTRAGLPAGRHRPSALEPTENRQGRYLIPPRPMKQFTPSEPSIQWQFDPAGISELVITVNTRQIPNDDLIFKVASPDGAIVCNKARRDSAFSCPIIANPAACSGRNCWTITATGPVFELIQVVATGF